MPAALQLALLIAILLPAGKLVAALSMRFGIPAILGELLVGVVAGPGCLNMLHMHLFSGTVAGDSFMLIAQIGGLVLMFMAGLETDIERMREASVTAFLVALAGVILPFALGAVAGHALGLSWSSACFLGGALTATSVSISARTLMDAGKMASKEATVILGAAVIDDVMGLFVLAFLAASCATGPGSAFGLAPFLSSKLQAHSLIAHNHPLTVQMSLIAVCVTVFFLVAFVAAKKWADPLMRAASKLPVNEAVTACVLALVLIYAVSAEWLGSVAGITGAYLLGYVFAGTKLKHLIENTFHAIGHGLLIPLFFVSIGLTSNFRALSGHWLLLGVIFAIAVLTKLVGCGSAALVMGMGKVRSLRVGCGMISRGEVGLIVTAMGASSGVFQQSEVAVMVTVVLLTTLITPLLLRGAFLLEDTQHDALGELILAEAEGELAFDYEARRA
ncbi:MAG TPA: cation:proton antiporter [Terracidiphilus sp.]|jgi:Kef-type K+ transport system membrane component KefB